MRLVRANGARHPALRSQNGKLGDAAHRQATCPTCGAQITREQYERILRITEARQQQLAAERATLERERQTLAHERSTIESAAAAAERAKWRRQAAAAEHEIARVCAVAAATETKLRRDHEKQMQTEVRKREAAEKQLARQLAAMEAKLRVEAEVRIRNACRAADQRHERAVEDLRERLKISEERRRRDEENWKRTVAELQQRADRRDVGHFGTEGEEDLVAALRAQFPGDLVERRGRSGDVLHTVMDGGRVAGSIVHEVKMTGAWQRDYLRQTKDAMEAHGTPYGVLVTRSMPARQSGLCIISGVIVVVPALAAQVVAVLREGIVAIARLRLSGEGKEAKTAALLEFVRSDEFGGAIRRVQEKVAELREALGRERSAHEGTWRMREQSYAAILRANGGIDARISELLGGKANGVLAARTHVNDAKEVHV